MLRKRERQGKLDTPFYPQPFQIVATSGSRITVESPQDARYDQNTSEPYHSLPENNARGIEIPLLDIDVDLKDSEIVDNPKSLDGAKNQENKN